jgi:glycosyltransferase involved in cell wall biosynthesis
LSGHIATNRAHQPLVSVVLPVRDASRTIDACLQSIVTQSYKQFEIIIIDDGSRDDSAGRVSAWLRRDPRITLLTQGAEGLVAALNRGLHRARGTLVARMDADDVMLPGRLQAQVNYLQANSDVHLAASQVALFSDKPIAAGYREYIRWQNACLSPEAVVNEIYIESPFAHPSVMFRRETVIALGGYRQGAFPEDYELWLRMAAAGKKMAKLPNVLLKWRDGEQRTSRLDSRYSRANFDALRADYLAKDRRLHSSRPLILWGAGRNSRKRAALLLNKGFKPAAWIDVDAKKIGNTYVNAPVVPPHWLKQYQRSNEKPFVLSYVNNHGARDLIGAYLGESGFRCGKDFLAVG